MKEYKVDGHESSLLPENKNWKLVWEDEFDGTELDLTKWDYRLHLFHKRHQAWTDDAVTLDGKSNAVFKIIEKDGEFVSSQLQTGENYLDRPSENDTWLIAPIKEPKFIHKYGYYEVRCKMQQTDVWWSAFWMQSPIIGCSLNPKQAGVEIDIMESFTPNKVIPHFIHYDGYGEQHHFKNSMGANRWATDADTMQLEKTPDGYHTFGFEWTKNGYTFYIDGKQSGMKIDGPVSDIEEFILLGTECKGYREEIPGFEENFKLSKSTDDCFIVDYVRVFDEI